MLSGSGFMPHGLPYLTHEMWESNVVPSRSSEFDAWAAEALARGDVDTLADFRNRAPGCPTPTPRSSTPSHLFVTLGAAGRPDAPVRTTTDGYLIGLSKRSFEAA